MKKKAPSSFLGWNIFLSYSEAGDKAAKKQGWVMLGYGKDNHGTEFKAYRMWKMKDKRKELELKQREEDERRELRRERRERREKRKKK